MGSLSVTERCPENLPYQEKKDERFLFWFLFFLNKESIHVAIPIDRKQTWNALCKVEKSIVST